MLMVSGRRRVGGRVWVVVLDGVLGLADVEDVDAVGGAVVGVAQ